ncbi:rho GTPase-activating protein 20 [Tupaia chinensis]|uniref:rho GTPase-activating protein 20 n=1 Tax=Tupaia chinensis TaxID=246437 RepID=UPI0003C8D0D8|nr:rho GTPase-activating protein 20 [Tupaia chinensis]
MFKSIKKHFKLSGGHLKLHHTSESLSEVSTHSEKTTSQEDANYTLLIHGPVEFRRDQTRQKRHLFLFKNLLLVANTRYKKCFKIKNKIPLNTLWTADYVDEVGKHGSPCAERSFFLGWPTVNFVVTFRSSEVKEQWQSFLQRYISLAKEKDQPKSIPLQIVTEDIKDCVPSVNITVTNSDTVNDTIKMSLQILGITGSEGDYQLCVRSGEDKAPYPLIGHEHPYGIKTSHLQATALLPQGPEWHEHPYGIKTSHLQATALLPQGPECTTSPPTLQEPFLKQPSPDMEDQFILKARCPARGQQRNNSDQKAVRKRRSFINWMFRRDTSTLQDTPSLAPPALKPEEFFGASLADICENGSLPTSLLDMLFILNQKGPLTEGIFRKSANIKSCRVLKEKLNSRVKVDMDSESVIVVASVFKDFLRNIQGSIFSSNLYDKWCDVIDLENEEEKIPAIQRLLEQLPKPNAALLRSLLGVLHNIEQHSSANQMTAYNLSVCIAPSLFWLPISCSTELENEFTKKVSFIQFLIENYLKIFGEDVTVSGESSPSCTNSEEDAAVKTEQPLEVKLIRVIVIYKKGTTTGKGQVLI